MSVVDVSRSVIQERDFFKTKVEENRTKTLEKIQQQKDQIENLIVLNTSLKNGSTKLLLKLEQLETKNNTLVQENAKLSNEVSFYKSKIEKFIEGLRD